MISQVWGNKTSGTSTERKGLHHRARTALRASLLSALVLSAALAIGSFAPAFAQSTIKVVVNDDAITSYDIAQRARLLQLTTRRSAGAAKKAAVEELIDERIKVQEAERLKVTVSESQVDEAFASIASRTKMSPANLSAALSKSGVRPSSLKDRIRSEMAWADVVRRRFRASIQVSEQDIIAALQKQGDDGDKTTTEVTLTQFIFVIPRNSSNGFKASRKREANALRGTFTSCEGGTALAQEYKEVVVKPLGIRLFPELPAAVKASLDGVDVGKLGKPLTTGNGIEVFAICNKREIKSDAAARNVIEADLRNKEGEMMARRHLRDLRRNAIIDYR